METTDKLKIIVQVNVGVPVAHAWKCWTTPADIMQWNYASDDWHTPRAENDLRQGGRFNYRMEAKDGSFGFGFSGVYSSVKINDNISYILDDGRKVSVSFKPAGDTSLITETFEAESTYPFEQQKTGWQNILNHFKAYAEKTDMTIIKSGSDNFISPCLWFDGQAMEAAVFYTSVFPGSAIGQVSYYGKEGFDIHGQMEGTVLAVTFRLNGIPFTALNGGPLFRFNESVSFQVFCDTQEEIDYYWEKLTVGGEESQCGWLKDKFGLSWQVVPRILSQLLSDPARAGKVTAVFMKMRKFEIDKLNII